MDKSFSLVLLLCMFLLASSVALAQDRQLPFQLPQELAGCDHEVFEFSEDCDSVRIMGKPNMPCCRSLEIMSNSSAKCLCQILLQSNNRTSPMYVPLGTVLLQAPHVCNITLDCTAVLSLPPDSPYVAVFRAESQTSSPSSSGFGSSPLSLAPGSSLLHPMPPFGKGTSLKTCKLSRMVIFMGVISWIVA